MKTTLIINGKMILRQTVAQQELLIRGEIIVAVGDLSGVC